MQLINLSRESNKITMLKQHKKLKVILLIFFGSLLLPEFGRIPVQNATAKDWNAKSFWFEPWGKSGVHKGIDIFGKKGTPILSSTYGIVVFKGNLSLGGRVVIALGPKWRLHYYAHLDSHDVFIGEPLLIGTKVGALGDSGNAKGKPAHLHYSVVTLVPYVWRIDASIQGWKKMFFLDPATGFSRDRIH
jgi:murein DD-endopeptidase MepM/ murein hydrolase activator NlpD